MKFKSSLQPKVDNKLTYRALHPTNNQIVLRNSSYIIKPIVNRDSFIIGHEIFLLQNEKHKNICNSIYRDSFLFEPCIRRNKELLLYICEYSNYLNSPAIFIDLGVYIFFDDSLLELILNTNKILQLKNIKLVIEITNNNIDFYTQTVLKGMFNLRDNDVILLKNNHSWWDLRLINDRVLTTLFGIIKINNPIKWKLYNTNPFIESRISAFKFVTDQLSSFKIIINEINNNEELTILKTLSINGFQGSLLDKKINSDSHPSIITIY